MDPAGIVGGVGWRPACPGDQPFRAALSLLRLGGGSRSFPPARGFARERRDADPGNPLRRRNPRPVERVRRGLAVRAAAADRRLCARRRALFFPITANPPTSPPCSAVQPP